MPVYDSKFSCVVRHVAGVTTQLNNVQNFNMTQGRQNLSDAYRSATMVIEGREPSALPTIKIGDFIEVEIQAFLAGVAVTLPASMTTHIGRVTDVTIEYGSISALDTWTITTEDAMAFLGRATVSLTVTAGTVTSNAAKQITDAVGVPMTIQGVTSPTTVKGVVFDKENALTAFQRFANTELAFVVQNGGKLIWYPRATWVGQPVAATFTDVVGATGSTTHNYNGLVRTGLADTTVGEVLISIVGGNTVTSGAASTYIEFETYNESDAQAVGLANYIKLFFMDKTPQPYNLSFLLTGQNPSTILDVIDSDLTKIALNYRGNSTTGLIMGYSISITPDVARASINLFASTLGIFVLDSTTSGILDTNGLGF